MIRDKKFIYVASPFSHEDEKVRDERVAEVEEFVAFITEKYYKECVFFSPIAHSGHVYKHMSKGFWRNFDFWIYEVDDYFLEIADEVWILKIDGWDISKGTKYEIDTSHARGLRTRYFEKRGTGGIPPVTYVCVKDEVVKCG